MCVWRGSKTIGYSQNFQKVMFQLKFADNMDWSGQQFEKLEALLRACNTSVI